MAFMAGCPHTLVEQVQGLVASKDGLADNVIPSGRRPTLVRAAARPLNWARLSTMSLRPGP